MIKRLIILPVVLTSLLLVGLTVQAQSSGKETLDTDSMSLSKLRREIRKAQSEVYDIYNELNDDDEYDIECTESRSAQSLIRERICLPNFMSAAYSEAAQSYVGGQNSTGGVSVVGNNANGSTAVSNVALPDSTAVALSQAEINEKNRILAGKMSTLANNHPNLNDAITRLKILNEGYQARMAAEK